MDPVANLNEQLRIAKQITAIWDDCNGSLTAEQAEEVAELASRLAELVLALAEWKQKGGFSQF